MTDTVNQTAPDLPEAEAPAEEWYSEEQATFGDRLVAAREAAELSQKALAKRLGVKPKTIMNWENDISEPRANRLQMLAGLLNVSLMWLLNGEGEGVAPPGAEEPMDADAKVLLLEMRNLRAEMCRSGDKLARLEKRLRLMLEAWK